MRNIVDLLKDHDQSNILFLQDFLLHFAGILMDYLDPEETYLMPFSRISEIL